MGSQPAADQTKRSKHRELSGFFKYGVTILAICLSSFHIYTALFGSFEALRQRPIHLFFGLPIILLLYPRSQKNKSKTDLIDIAMVLFAMISIGWIIFDYGVHYCVADLVTDLVWMSFCHTFRCE